MATVLEGLQTTMAQLAKNSELQTEPIQNLKEDILLCSGDEDTKENPNLVPRVSHLNAWGERGETLVGSGHVSRRKVKTLGRGPL